MVRDLLWLEMVAKLVAGTGLLLVPRTLARVLGLPPVAETMWPRLAGAALVGMSVATLLEGRTATGNGLGLAGHVAINLALALTLVGLLIIGRAGTTVRGRIFAGLAAALLTVLALVELAWV